MTPVQSTLLTYLAIAVPIAFVLCLIAGLIKSWRFFPIIGRIVLLLPSFILLWWALAFGVAHGFDAWQAMPDAPDAAYADGAALTGSLIMGWVPAGAFVGFVFTAVTLIAHAARRMRQGHDALENQST